MSRFFSSLFHSPTYLILILLSLSSVGNTTPYTKTTTTLSKINTKLVRLSTHQAKENQKKSSLENELRRIDIHIAKTTRLLEQANLQINQTQRDINQIQSKQAPLEKRFNDVQTQLSQYLLLTSQLNKANPLYLILNKKDPTLTTRLMRYLGDIKKHQIHLLLEVIKLNKSLSENKTLKEQKLSELTELKEKQQKHLQRHNDDKHLQRDIIKDISMRLTDRSFKIRQLRKNKLKLQTILKNIEQLKQRQTDNVPFYSLKRSLPWPIKQRTKGRQLNATNDSRGNGLFIHAQEGRQIHAVRTGKVVFADWLRGYGLLIILQHDNGFMTLYANNQALYKDKGENAYTGEKIATIGHSGGQLADGLYFEIRKNGRALPPLSWLKQRH